LVYDVMTRMSCETADCQSGQMMSVVDMTHQRQLTVHVGGASRLTAVRYAQISFRVAL